MLVSDLSSGCMFVDIALEDLEVAFFFISLSALLSVGDLYSTTGFLFSTVVLDCFMLPDWDETCCYCCCRLSNGLYGAV